MTDFRYLIPVEVESAGPYHDDTNGSYFKGRIHNSPVGSGYTLSISYSQVVTREQIEVEVRERIVAEIEAEVRSVSARSFDTHEEWFNYRSGMVDAARIARGTK